MATVPSIKGSIFGALVEDAKKALERGNVSREKAARWLAPEDFALFDTPIVVSSWYDIRAYTRFSEFLRDVEGGGSNEYLRERGRRNAQRLLEGGLYRQLKYLHRTELSKATDAKARFQAFGRDLRLLTTVTGAILNFGRQTPKPDPDHEGRYILDITEAEPYPEALCWGADGFINGMASVHGEADLWKWRRPAPDHIVQFMTRSL